MGMGEQVKNGTSGYSGTPLAKKLGIKTGFTIRLINAPDHYLSLFTDLPAGLNFTNSPFEQADMVHFFTQQAEEYITVLPILKAQLRANGMIWLSWPKKASKIKTDITEDLIRNFAIKTGLVDIKVCAVDETWSGLKLVIPLKDR